MTVYTLRHLNPSPRVLGDYATLDDARRAGLEFLETNRRAWLQIDGLYGIEPSWLLVRPGGGHMTDHRKWPSPEYEPLLVPEAHAPEGSERSDAEATRIALGAAATHGPDPHAVIAGLARTIADLRGRVDRLADEARSALRTLDDAFNLRSGRALPMPADEEDAIRVAFAALERVAAPKSEEET